MCIFLAALILILVFYASADLAQLQLVEAAGDHSIVVASNWDILTTLWPLFLAAGLTGILIFVVAMKFIPKEKQD